MEDPILLKYLNEDNSISDFWLFDDDYIKEVKYIGKGTKVFIYEINDFVQNHPNHPILDTIKNYKEGI